MTYVSGKGIDTGTCTSPANPCRTFQFAVDASIAGGEVKALDPAYYGPVTITKSISITGVDGAGIDSNGGNAITVTDTNPGTINLALTNLVIQNVTGSGGVGISVMPSFISLSITITHCTVRGFITGIEIGQLLFPAPASQFLIADTVVTNNQVGINIGFAGGTLDHVIANLNSSTGVQVADRGIVTAVDTIANDNGGSGFVVTGLRGILTLAHSTALGNNGSDVVIKTGLSTSVTSFGDNHIGSVSGNLTQVALK
ncbi:MAG TPA: right-handed parallel beta-helix repeat-containing protein [Methylocella sp.]|nr:right-handed parallel beta-helix repeat-containing protein [Methylocella sp.]